MRLNSKAVVLVLSLWLIMLMAVWHVVLSINGLRLPGNEHDHGTHAQRHSLYAHAQDHREQTRHGHDQGLPPDQVEVRADGNDKLSTTRSRQHGQARRPQPSTTGEHATKPVWIASARKFGRTEGRPSGRRLAFVSLDITPKDRWNSPTLWQWQGIVGWAQSLRASGAAFRYNVDIVVMTLDKTQTLVPGSLQLYENLGIRVIEVPAFPVPKNQPPSGTW